MLTYVHNLKVVVPQFFFNMYMDFVLNFLRIFYGIHVLLLVHKSWCEECSSFKMTSRDHLTLARLILPPPLSLRNVNTEDSRVQMPHFFEDQVFNPTIQTREQIVPNTLLPAPRIFRHAVDPAFSLFHSVITNTNWLSVNCPTNKPLFYVSVLTSLSVIVEC